jgi:lipopolysaccharide/colanic/teichoic acid biosynthesis glycosyltransferase
MNNTRLITKSIGLSSLSGKSRHDQLKSMIIVDEANLGMLEKILQHNEWGHQVIYILTDSSTVKARFRFRSRIYSMNVNIRSLIRHDIVDEIVCCVSGLPIDYLKNLEDICSQFGISLLVQTGFNLTGLSFSKYGYIGHLTFYTLEHSPRHNYKYIVKTGVEIVFASCALFILSPLLMLIVLLIKSTSRGPVIFKQLRVGLRGRKFYIYKFRTMIADAEKLRASLQTLNESDGPAFKIKHDPRITYVGRILRKTGLDEIPQLYNIMKGEMSLIGPRPMLPNEVSEQKEWQLKRLSIKPGITCTWQIQPNRNSVPFERWMLLDRDYVENWTLKKDIKLFVRTVFSIFAAKGV